MSIGNLAPYALAAQKGLALQHDDPLRYFRYRCEGQRQMVQYVVDGLDVHAHAPNGAGKTITSENLTVALCRGRSELDGVKLPGLKPGEAWYHGLIVPTRKQQVMASQKALVAALGNYPHIAGYSSRANDYIETVWIRPEWCTSGEREKWSKVIIHCEESAGSSVPGGRFNSFNSDEYPDERTWGEVRARWMADQKLLKWIAATPTLKSRWWWAFKEESGYLRCFNAPRAGRVSVNWRLEDVHGPEKVAEIRESYAGDRVLQARLTGWPVDDEGTSPFDAHALNEMREGCCPPIETWAINLQDETDDEHDRETLARKALVQVWVNPETWHRARIIVDPSAGINDGRHDPNGFLLLDEVDPTVCARYNGYLDPYSLGYLAGTVGKRWAKVCGEHPWIDVEMQNGWGGETIKALRRMRYPNIGHRMVVEDPHSGKKRPHYGFPNTDSERSRWIAAIQAGLIRKSFKCWSREVVDCLTDVVLDDRERAIKGPGGHIEDMIELGYGLHRISDPKKPTQRQKDGPDFLRQALRNDFGRDVDIPDGRYDGGSATIPEAFGLVK